jgi:flagellin-like hook-associated protein FlgL
MIAALSKPNSAGSPELQHAAKLLELDIDRLSQAMAEVGSRHQYNEFLLEQNESLLIDLKANLSQEVEVDMIDAISQLTAQQATVEASLKMVAQTFRTSLLDYI